MRNLFLFIKRFYPFFLFLLLEIASLILVAGANAHQGATFVNSSNRVTGRFYLVRHNIHQYFGLRQTNEKLLSENAQLRLQLSNVRTLADSGYADTAGAAIYDFLPATVINHSTHRQFNYFTLDKGAADGIVGGMGVVDPAGVVGMVTNASEHYSVGISMLNGRTRVSIRHQRSGALGILRWQGRDPAEHIVEDISKTAGVLPGDTLVTSGYSTFFPGGLPVAVVKEAVLGEGSDFFEIRAELTNEISSLDKVYVVRHLYRNELDSLENRVE